MDDKAQKNPFQDTLNLPKTDFSIRANAQVKELEILAGWETDDIAQRAMIKNKGKKKFILHDGPPYANGHLHIGHAMTYILKDIVCKSKRMDGFHAPLVPGWDCHGLPIEHKVTTERGLEKDKSSIDRVELKKWCREFAANWIEIQKVELKELGKLADYKNYYSTMSPGYEASIIRSFATFVEKGYIERKLKTVPWCASCQTVLATVEIEYKDRKDPSIMVLFPLPDAAAHMTFPFLLEKKPNLKISFAVWTTTPWTLPLNRAVVLNPSAVYSVLQGRTPDEAIIVAQALADKVCAQIGIEKVELAECDSVVFDGKQAEHPFVDDLLVPLLLDDMVQISEGTACLHSAPGCGPDDYMFGVKKGLEIFSPLSPDGRYTKGIAPAELEGMAITDGMIWVLRKLTEKGRLLYKASITHSYPHCWRCLNGLMFRATSQWFCNLQKNDLVKKALGAIEKIKFTPARGQARLHAFTENRTEWCISRQRHWGTPITALLCNSCGWSFLDAAFIKKVADRVETEGIEFWDRMSFERLITEGLLDKNFACGDCGNNDSAKFTLERDILDVWFDSGVSSAAVLAKDPENLDVPADLYFEGSDQHRGWFQSSLLCGMVLFDQAPMHGIATHGYVVDEQHRKMSKSLGNGVAPSDVMKKHSRDILRLWVAAANYEDDVVISEKLLQSVAEMYRKIRNTSRFMIANLYDFDIATDAVPVEKLMELDAYALMTLKQLQDKVREHYDAYNFAAVTHALNNYCTTTLSSMYLDILKDRLYVEQPDGFARRSAQTVLYHILDVMTRLMAPVLSFLAEEISDFYQKGKAESIHLQDFVTEVPHRALDANAWELLETLRESVIKAIEPYREKGIVKHPYEAVVQLQIDASTDQGQALNAFKDALASREDAVRFFKDWFIVSDVQFVDALAESAPSSLAWAGIAVDRAQGVKCPRCWQWTASSHEAGLCVRCNDVLI
jgi:isoleucyl-tRNA synthetase